MSLSKQRPLLSAHNLSLSYPGSQKPVLSDINLNLYPGEILLLTGPSGSGKSSLLHSLSGLIPRNIPGTLRGNMYLEDNDLSRMTNWEISKNVSLIFQEPEDQFFTMQVEDELAFGPENHGLEAQEIITRTYQAAQSTGTESLLPRPIHILSEGQKQRVAIAANLTLKPKTLLFDEPTSNLDEGSTIRFYALIKALSREENRAMVICEHRLQWPHQYADRLIILKDGRIQYDGNPQILQNSCMVKKWGLRDETQHPDLSTVFWKMPTSHTPLQPVLFLDHLSFRFGRKSNFLFTMANFYAEKGEAIALFGENGAGKTTFLRLLAGLLTPTEGKVLLQGEQVHRIPKKRRCRMVRLVLQNTDHQLFMPTVLSELAFLGDHQKALHLLDQFKLASLENRHPHSLSVGEKQRLAIAAALIYEPNVLLLDEPTSGMDGANIDRLIGMLREYKKQGMTIVIASHDTSLIRAVCDRGIKLLST